MGQLETIKQAGVEFVVQHKLGRQFLCMRPNGRKLYYIEQHANGKYSKPKIITVPASRILIKKWEGS